jgi:hypothetical protein
MKPELQRIETALHQLSKASPTENQKTSATVGHQTNSLEEHSVNHSDASELSFSMAVQPFPTRKNQVKTPTLPRFKSPTFSNHRHAANPALAMN